MIWLETPIIEAERVQSCIQLYKRFIDDLSIAHRSASDNILVCTASTFFLELCTPGQDSTNKYILLCMPYIMRIVHFCTYQSVYCYIAVLAAMHFDVICLFTLYPFPNFTSQ
jgi:hypothetical protein